MAEEINKSGVAFWIFTTLIAIGTFVYILIWSFQNNSAKGIAIGSIFLAMIFAGLIFALFSKQTLFDKSTWGDNSLSFTLGFVIWSLLGSIASLSVISLPKQYLFASISSELPQLLEFAVNGILVPIAEEVFWMIALPFSLIFIMNSLGKEDSFWRNKYFQIAVIMLIGATTFAYFHVGALALTGFIIIAMFFRSVMVVSVYADQEFNWLSRINLVPSFAIGAHMANNLSTYGWAQIKLIMFSNFFPAGLIIIIFFAIMFISGFERILSLIFGKERTVVAQ